MKMLSLVSAMVFCAALFSLSARADEPPALKLTPQIQAVLAELLKAADAEPARADEPPALKLTPQIQAMLAELLKAADAEPAPDTEPANPTPVAPVTAPSSTAAPAPPAAANQPATGLRTGSLRSGGLMTSAPLGGHGLNGGTPRLTDAEWRQQFPGRR